MRWVKGQSGNPAGRKAGSKGRNTEQMRNLIGKFLSANLKNLQDDLNKLSPEKRLILLERFMRYVIPPAEYDLSKLSEKDLDLIINRLKEKESPQMSIKQTKIA